MTDDPTVKPVPQHAASVRPVPPAARTVACLAVLLLAAFPARVDAKTYGFTPLKCDAQDRFFVALGHTVLAIPDTPVTTSGIARIRNSPDRLMPPDATQPEGCLANPAQAVALFSMAVTFAYDYAIWPDNKNFPGSRIAIRDLVVAHPNVLRHIWASAANNVCRSPTAVTQEHDGVTVCHDFGPNALVDVMPEQTTTAYIFSQAAYPTFSGENLSFTCPKGANLVGTLYWCTAVFELSQDLQVDI